MFLKVFGQTNWSAVTGPEPCLPCYLPDLVISDPTTTLLIYSPWCGNLDENSPYRLIYLNAWSLAGRTIWGGLGGVALLEEVYTGGRLWCFQSSCHSQLAFSAWCKLSVTASAPACLTAAMLPTIIVMDSNPLESWATMKCLFYRLPWSWCFVMTAEKELRESVFQILLC